mmetsp:Transcript_21091/g.38139  ORF Transcript_21091/g.38139 Transcript_21091/m.38139 type:complete len:1184 (-) Transcript_21091:33-3584(-)
MAPPTRDFAKRPKAKVGKRAPAKINSTDTAFKTASVAVRPQAHILDKNKNAISAKQLQGKDASSAAARMELASSQGNALSTLQASMRHHAPAVRASGLKGVRDAVQSLSSLEVTLGTYILEANLPSLLPNMCRCWLDEDDDVRGLAVNLFGDIIKNLKSSSEQADLKCLAPFVPFLCAYASSALNSLDRSIRKDGALIVGMLSSSEPSPSFSSLTSSSGKEGGLSAMAVEMGKHVDLFIPPLERLLSSMSLGGRGVNAGSKEGKKRKRDTINTTPTGPALAASVSTLLSLALLVRASLGPEGGDSQSNLSSGGIGRRLDPSLYVSGECTFLRGGSAHANSLLLFRESGRNYNDLHKPIRSIMDLPSIPADELVDEMENAFAAEGDVLVQAISTENDTTKFEKVQRMTSLLETLRMKFVELSHSGRKSDNDKDGLIMSTADLETVDVLVQTIRFVHRRCQSYQSTEDQQQAMKQSKTKPAAKRQPLTRGKRATAEIQDIGECLVAYKTTVTKALTLLLETFPVCPMDNVSASRYELTNAGICSALAELGGDNMFEDSRGSSSQWMNSVFSYIIPRLNSTSETKEDSTEKMYSGAEGVATNMLLKVVSKLLLPHGVHHDSGSGQITQNYLLKNPFKRHELLEAFAGAFFPRLAFPSVFESKGQSGSLIYTSSPPAGVEQKVEQLASTAMGKTAAMLLTTLITQSADRILEPSKDDKNKLDEKRSMLLLQMSSVLPVYLVSWEGRVPIESGLVLASFIAIARQWSESTDDNVSDGSTMSTKRALNDLCLGLRRTLEALYTTSKTQPSIFERLPEQVQKLCVGLIGLLKFPSEALTKTLADICSKSFAPHRVSNDSEEVAVISNSMANYFMEVMHSLRKTMSMPMYLTFLIDGCGIKYASRTSMMQQKSVTQDGDAATDPFSESVFFYDKSIGQLCRFLTTSCDQASSKVLPMIRPVLQKWLSATSASTNDVIKQLVQSRAAISIVAGFTWDEVLSSHDPVQRNSGFVAPEFLKLDEKLDRLLVNCIIDQFELSAKLWSMGGGGYNMDDLTAQQQYLARLLGPITMLLRYRHGMFGHFLEGVCGRVVRQSQDTEQQEESTTSGKDASVTEQGDAPSKKINVAEVHMKALLLVLKSKEPVSMVDLVRNNKQLKVILLSAAEDIQKTVSGGHLAHLGNKLLHQAKLCTQ